MENGTLVIGLTLTALLLFGIAYNAAVAWLEKSGRSRGSTALLVVAGVLATLVGMGLIDRMVDWNAFFIGLAAFTASGTPMILGSLWRSAQERQDDERAAKLLARELLDDCT